ncbi:LodA/GoxA family CTQ-dependent oxidase [Saccharothrix hoggarensis]|uniref:LodA/GoxA family CTQ-dependent oxidase n=1 Tax=Saccharothrix hoggarensis TaxID=913853 RepID=A0ABW3QW68_9PSEU
MTLPISEVTKVKIHPAIGVARLGNSDEYFVGPEIPGQPGLPADKKFKDASGKVRRQAARFRCFGYDETGTRWVELTDSADVSITWSVHVVNRKAASKTAFGDTEDRNRDVTGDARKKLVIDPGVQTITGKDAVKAIPKAPFTHQGKKTDVDLGALRTDGSGHLLVLGGRGSSGSPTGKALQGTFDNDGWHDDTSDGPVGATVKIKGRAVGDVTGAWVVVAPPKFAPYFTDVISMYERLLDYYKTHKIIEETSALLPPATPSYAAHVQPILQRARTIRWTRRVKPYRHRWEDPVYGDASRHHIFDRLKPATGTPSRHQDMPHLTHGGSTPGYDGTDSHLTAVQYEVMKRWKDGNYRQDWPPPAARVTPDGLDRAALDGCVGGSLFPGIEFGRFALRADTTSIWRKGHPFRFDTNRVRAGDVTARMALPWQTDFMACGSDWWPVQRPNTVIADNKFQAWDRMVGNNENMVKDWYKLGFVLPKGSQYVEQERTLTQQSTVRAGAVNFGTVGTEGRTVPVVVHAAGAVPDLVVENAPGAVTVGTPRTSGDPTSTLLSLDLTYAAARADVVDGEVVLLDRNTGDRWTIPVSGRGASAADEAGQPYSPPVGVDLLLAGQGVLSAGQQHTWTLQLTEVDHALSVTLQAADGALSVVLVSPLGRRLDAGVADVHATKDAESATLRVELPFESFPSRYDRSGLWRVVVTADEGADALPYQVTASAESDIRLVVDSTDSGAEVTLWGAEDSTVEAVLAEGAEHQVTLDAGSSTGRVDAGAVTSVRAFGTSPDGHPFVRERYLTGER